MLTIHFYPYEDEKEIHKKVAEAEANYYHAINFKPAPLPAYIKPAKPKQGLAGWYNFAIETLKELRP